MVKSPCSVRIYFNLPNISASHCGKRETHHGMVQVSYGFSFIRTVSYGLFCCEFPHWKELIRLSASPWSSCYKVFTFKLKLPVKKTHQNLHLISPLHSKVSTYQEVVPMCSCALLFEYCLYKKVGKENIHLASKTLNSGNNTVQIHPLNQQLGLDGSIYNSSVA